MKYFILILFFLLLGCPKQKDTKTQIELEREKALQELMNIDEEEFIEELPEEEGDDEDN